MQFSGNMNELIRDLESVVVQTGAKPYYNGKSFYKPDSKMKVGKVLL